MSKLPKFSAYPVRVFQVDFSDNFPPTIYGMEQAVLQWAPLAQAHANGLNHFEICHDVQVEEDMENWQVHITALVDSEMAERLATCEVKWTPDVIREQLDAYLDHYRPLGVKLLVRVLVQAPHTEGPYR